VIRLLIVDDQELVRAGLRGVLRARFGFEIVGECPDGADVPAAVDTLAPDVVVMDVRMPGVDGIAATRQLRTRPDAPPVLALTTFDDDEVLAGMLRAGAAGFALKGAPADELHRAVRAVADGAAWLDPAVTSRVLSVFRRVPAPGPDVGCGLARLTDRERDVLALIGHGLTNAEIAARFVVAEGTVKTHVNHVFAKLGLRDRPAAIVFAYDNQLVTPQHGRD
jgi:DNA-binding NarL/FixJ family response regulator